jgi:sulfite exporter TauE/SafE
MAPALLLGFAGSVHCLGMCGPLQLAVLGGATGKLWLKTLEYQLGRVLSYTGLGVFFGLAGKAIALAGFQQVLSLLAGIFMVAFALLAWRLERWLHQWTLLQRWSAWLQHTMGGVLQRHPDGASFSFGLLNGLVPCGLVYAALAGAVSMSDPVDGAAFMFYFGVGTTPLMVGLALVGRRFSTGIRTPFRYIQPVLLLLSGALLIQRGLHLDLSLFESAVPPADLECH